MNPELAALSRLTGQLALGVSFLPPTIEFTCNAINFYMSSRDINYILMLADQVLYLLNHISSPILF